MLFGVNDDVAFVRYFNADDLHIPGSPILRSLFSSSSAFE